MSISLKKSTTVAAFIISPLILASLGSALSSLTRIYVSSGTFVLSIFLGALVTSAYYSRSIHSKAYSVGIILIFGIIVPILYINAAHEVFGSGIRQYNEIWSPIYLATTLIGLIEIILYTGIFANSFFTLLSRLARKIVAFATMLIKKSIVLVSKNKSDSPDNIKVP